MFEHFLVTRFNLRVPGWDTTKSGLNVLSDTWLEDRFELFENYCLPSVLNQKEKKFKWFIYFDNQTSKKFHSRIKHLEKRDSIISCYFIDGIGTLKTSLIDNIHATILPNTKWVITSRLDNDDVLHEEFIETIQKQFVPQHETVVDLRNGLQINIKTSKVEVRQLYNKFNPFISLIEETAQLQTVLSKPHASWIISKNLIIYESTPLWIEVVHENNKLNEVGKYQKLLKKIKVKQFGLNNLTIKFSPDYVTALKNRIMKINYKIKYQVGRAKLVIKKII